MQNPVHPKVQAIAAKLRRWGSWQVGILILLLLAVLILLTYLGYTAVFNREVILHEIQLLLVYSLPPIAVLLLFLFYLILRLDDALNYLSHSVTSEHSYSQSMQENIRQLNFEIEERKRAFQAKRNAIEELRREITERRKTEQELAEQSLLIRSIVDSSPDLFYYRNEQGLLASCNKMFENIMQRPMAELIGKNLAELYPADSPQAAILLQYQPTEPAIELTLDVAFQQDGGDVLWFEMRHLPFYDRQGKYIGLLGFGRDITSRKLAEQALEKAYHDKGQFIATLSHELRTPLNGIVGLSRRLLSSHLSAEQHSWANTIFTSAETLGNIFNDIIDLDKIDRQDLDIVYQSVHLPQFLDDMANFAQLICQQKGLAFTLTTESGFEPYVMLDPTRLRQVLWNLLNNAVKFTKQGEVRLHCKVRQQHLLLQVSDTGIGISSYDLPKIFDLYFKSKDGERLSIVGSGIGLSVSQALIEAMSGKIEVSSEPGEGSCFSIYLPLRFASAPEPLPAISCPQLNILLVEDVPLNADIVINLLEQRGHTVVHAETGEDALALLETEDELDLVLLDMQLPDMSGDQIARHIRAEAHLAQLPIIVLTANVRKAQQALAELNLAGTLSKPLNTDKLDQLLAEIFAPSALRMQQVKVQTDELPASALDYQILQHYLQSLGKEAMLRSALLFQQLLPGYINSMLKAAVQQDIEAFVEMAHKLKGAAAAIGLSLVQQQAKKLEDNTYSDWQLLEAMVLELHKTAEQHLVTLQQYLDQN